MRHKVVRYSEAFKVEVVRGLDCGELASVCVARRRYGIQGHGTVESWVRRYGKDHLLPKVVRVEKPGEAAELQRLRRENKRLKQALADSQVDGSLYRSYFEVLCRETERDPEMVKKKLGVKR